MELNSINQDFMEMVHKTFPVGSISGQQVEYQSDINELKFVYVCDSTCSVIWTDKRINKAETYCAYCGRHFIQMKERE